MFRVYDTSKFQLINYHFLDLLLMIGFMTIYFPKQLPPNFTADYGDDEGGETGEIYQVNLGNTNEIMKQNILYNQATKKNLELSASNQYPVLIIHPFHFQNPDSNICINKIIETSNVGFVTNN